MVGFCYLVGVGIGPFSKKLAVNGFSIGISTRYVHIRYIFIIYILSNFFNPLFPRSTMYYVPENNVHVVVSLLLDSN